MDMAMLSIGMETSGLQKGAKAIKEVKTESIKAQSAVDKFGNEISETDAKLGRFIDKTGKMREANGRFVSGLTDTHRMLGKTSTSLDKNSNSATAFVNKFNNAKNSILGFTVAGVGLSALATGAINMGAAFDEAMNTVQSKLLITGQEMDVLKDKAKELGASTSFSAKEAGDGMSYLAQAGLDANQILSATPTILTLASAAGMDLAKSADIATNVMGAFKMQVSDLPAIADLLALTSAKANTSVEELAMAIKQAGPIAQGFGVSIEETSAVLGQLANNGFKGEQAGMVFKNMLSSLANPVGETKKTLGELKVVQSELFDKMSDGSMKFKGVAEMLDLLAEKGASTTDIIRIFGAEAGPALISLVGSSSAINKLEESISKTGAAAEMAAIKMQGLPAVLKIARSTWEALNLALMDKGGTDLAVGAIQGVTTIMQSVINHTREWTIALGTLALFMSRNMITAGTLFVASQVKNASAMAGATMAAITQRGALTASSVAMGVATTAGRGLSVVMGLLGGPVGLLAMAAVAAFAYRDELSEIGKTTRTTEQITKDNNDVVDKAKKLAYDYADATGTAKESLRTQGEEMMRNSRLKLDNAKATLEATRAQLKMVAAMAGEGGSIREGTRLSSGEIAGIQENYKNAVAALNAEQEGIKALEDQLNNFGKTREELNRINGESIGVTRTVTVVTNTLTNSTKEAKSAFDREKQALTQAVIAKTQGKEAAYRYQLSLEKLTKPQIELLVNLKRQSGAFDEVKKKTAAVISEYERELRALTQSNIEKERGKLAAYEYAISLKNITPEEQKFLVSLKKKELSLIAAKEASEKATAETKRNAEEAQRSAKRIKDAYDREVEALTKNNTAKEQGKLAAYEYAVSLMNLSDKKEKHLISLKKKAIALDDLEEKQKAFNDLVKQAKQSLEKAETPLQTYVRTSAEYADMLSKKAINQSEYNKLVNNAYDIYKKNDPALKALTKAQEENTKAKKDAEKAEKDANTALELARKSIGKSDQEVRALTLSYKKGYTEELANNQAQAEFSKKATDELRDAQQNARESNEKSIKLEELARQSIGKTEEQIRSLTLQLDKGYNKKLADSQAATESSTKAYKEIKDLIEDMKDPYEKLAEETEYLNKLYKTGELDALTYSKALEKVTEKYDEVAIEAKKAKEEAEKLHATISQDVSSSLTDAFLSGDYSSLGRSLVDTFKTNVSEPLMNDIFKPLSESISNIMTGSIKSVSGGINSLTSSLGSVGTSIMSTLSSGGLSGISMGGSLGSMAGQLFGQSGIGSGIGGAIGTMFGPIGTAIGSGIGGLIESLFGGGPQTIEGTFGQFATKVQGDNESYENSADRPFYATKRSTDNFNRTSEFGQFGILTKGSVSIGRDDPEQLEGISDALDAMQSLDTVIASFLPDETISAIKTNLDGYTFNALDTTALIKDRTTQIFSSIPAVLQNALLNGSKIATISAEELASRFAYVAQVSDSQLIPALEIMGSRMGETEDEILAIAVQLSDMAGGLDAITSSVDAYYAAVYTAEEQSAKATEIAQAKLTEFNESMGLTGDRAITGVETLRAYVESLNLANRAGREAYIAAMGIVDSATAISGTAEEIAQAALDAANNVDDLSNGVDGLSDSVDDFLSQTDILTNAISNMVTSLYGSAEDAYQKELARYNSLKNGAESLRQTVAGFSDSVTTNAGTLESAQTEYNRLYEAVKGGDTESVNELQTAAIRLRESMSEQYAGGSQATAGTLQIEKQLNALISNMESTAGEAPISPTDAAAAATLTEADRSLLAGALLESLQELSLATDKSVLSLMSENGIYINQLAKDIGIDVGNLKLSNKALSQKELLKMADLGKRINASGIYVAKNLGADLTSYATSVTSSLAATDGIPQSIIDGMKPYLDAVDASTTWEDLENNFNTLGGYVNSLPSDIKDKLNNKLNDLIGSNNSGTNAIKSLSTMTKDELKIMSKSFGIDVDGLKINNNKISSNELVKLNQIGQAVSSSGIHIAKELGTDLTSYATSVTSALSATDGIPQSILDSMQPYLTAVNESMTWDDLEKNFTTLSGYINTLPSGIKEKLNSSLNGIIGSTSQSTNAINKLSSLTNTELSELSKAFGVDINSLISSGNKISKDNIIKLSAIAAATSSTPVKVANALGVSIDSIKDSIVTELTTLTGIPESIKDELKPYIEQIQSATNVGDIDNTLISLSNYIDTLPEDIKNKLKTSLTWIAQKANDTKKSVDSLINTSVDQTKILAEALGLDIESLKDSAIEISKSQIEKLSAIAEATGKTPAEVANSLGSSVESIKKSIVSELITLTDIPQNIKDELAPYIEQIQSATNVGDIDNTLSSLSSYIDTLPEDIKTKLNGNLSWIAQKANDTRKSIDAFSALNDSQLKQLSKDFGIDIDSLMNSGTSESKKQISKIAELASITGLGPAKIAESLGLTVDSMKKSIVSELSGLTEIPTSIKDELAPYIEQIQSATSVGDIDNTLSSLSKYIDTLPEDIKSKLNANLSWIAKKSNETTKSVDSLSDITKEQAELLADAYGVDIDSLKGVNNNNAKNNLERLRQLSQAVGKTPAQMASQLGLTIDEIKTSIVSELSDLTEIPESIKDELKPYIEQIQAATSVGEIDATLSSLSGYIDTLPEDIRKKLNYNLSWIAKKANETTGAVDSLSTITKEQAELLAESYGIDIESLKGVNNNNAKNNLNKLAALAKAVGKTPAEMATALGLTIEEIKTSIVSELSDLTEIPESIKDELAPYIEQIQAATSVGEIDTTLSSMSKYIDTLPEDIRNKLNYNLSWIAKKSNDTRKSVDDLDKTTQDKFKELIKEFGIDIDWLGGINNNNAKNNLNKLNALAKAVGNSPAEMAKKLGIEISEFADLVAGQIELDASTMSTEIQNGLSPLLEQLKKSTTVEEVEAAYDTLNSYLETLPDDIRDKLSSSLGDIGTNTEKTKNQVKSSVKSINSGNKLYKESLTHTSWLDQINKKLSDLWYKLNQQSIMMNKAWKLGYGDEHFTADNTSAGAKSYDIGSDYIESDQVANIHKGEAIFTAAQSSSLRTNALKALSLASKEKPTMIKIDTENKSDDKSDIINKELLKEIKELKEAQKAANFQLAKNTKDTYKLLDRWEAIGLPVERV